MKKEAVKDKQNWIKFLGTAGARFVMIRQLRASGGIWINFKDTNILIDPGPGSIVRCAMSRPKLDPGKLDAIILTHRHLDHANDINVMIEAMTEGGFKKRGVVFLPYDALDVEPVILSHTRGFVDKIEILKSGTDFQIKNIKFSAPCRNIHPVETYGLKFTLGSKTVSLITDTLYFDKIKECYSADIVIINVVFFEPRPGIQHLSIPDVERIILEVKPRVAILTHFGMTVLTHKPHIIAEKLKDKLGIDVISAYDGMTFDL